MSSVTFIHRSFNSSVSSYVRLFIMLALTHQASQPAVCHLISIIHFIYSHSFIFFFIHFSFFRSFVHLFVHSFVLLSLIIDIFSLSDDTFLDTIFRIRCFKLDILKIYFCSKIDIMDGEVGISRSSHKYSPHC